MPLYPYTCTSCGHSFEALVATVAAEPPADCPECGGTKLEREFGLPARPTPAKELPTNCRGDGPPCGAPWCGRQ